MDFSNITGMYADTYANAANQRAAGLQDKLKGADYAKATDAELMDACKQFEAYFIEQMYKGMMKTIPTNENNSNYTATMMDYYKDGAGRGGGDHEPERRLRPGADAVRSDEAQLQHHRDSLGRGGRRDRGRRGCRGRESLIRINETEHTFRTRLLAWRGSLVLIYEIAGNPDGDGQRICRAYHLSE